MRALDLLSSVGMHFSDDKLPNSSDLLKLSYFLGSSRESPLSLSWGKKSVQFIIAFLNSA